MFTRKQQLLYLKERIKLYSFLIKELKESSPCFDCKKKFPHYIMEFDHCRGKKTRNVPTMAHFGSKRIHEEISKCDLVCANCHRSRTWKRKII